MAAIISIAVGAIGTMVGTAIGAAIGGTILGISAATIGGIIGAGLAGGVLSWAQGGEFGKGFLMGAAGGAIGAFAKAGIGALSGGGGAAGGVAEGAAAGAEGAATTGALEGVGATGGLEGITSASGDLIGEGAASLGEGSAQLGTSGGIGMGTAASGTAGVADASGFSLDSLGGAGLDAYSGSVGGAANIPDTSNLNSMSMNQGNLTQGNLTTPTTGGFNADPTQSSYGLTDSSKLLSMDYGGETTAGGTEGFGSAPEAGSYSMSSDANTGSPVGGGSVLNKSDNWLGENLGMKSGSTAKLAKGGLEYLYKNYQTDKLAREVNKLKPMTFEEYASQFTDPGAYRQASATMAKGGRTGTLPALLARMKNEARGKYAGYLQPQQEKYLAGQAGIANQRTQNLGGLLTTLGSTGMGM